MVAHLVSLGIGITLAFFSHDMDQNRAAITVGRLEGASHLADVMTIDRPHVSKAELLENSANFGDREATHAAFQTVQLSWELTPHERQMSNTLFNASRQKLHGGAQSCSVQHARKSTHRRRDRHVVVVQHHQEGRIGKVASVVNCFKGHAPR